MNDLKFVTKVLSYLIREANGWHEECRGSRIESVEMDEAVNLLEMFQSMDSPEEPKPRIITSSIRKALN